MSSSIKISHEDTLYSVADKEIAKGFNAAAGFDGFAPSAQLSYNKSSLDKKGEGMMTSAGIRATLGEGIVAGGSVVQKWTVPVDGNRLDVMAGGALEASTRTGRLDASVGMRADYVRKDGLSPYFTAIASTREDRNLTIGAGVCKDVQISVLPEATVCGGVEMRGDRPAAAFSIGRSF